MWCEGNGAIQRAPVRGVSGCRSRVRRRWPCRAWACRGPCRTPRSEEHTSELQSPCNLVCRLLLEKKKKEPIQELACDFSSITQSHGIYIYGNQLYDPHCLDGLILHISPPLFPPPTSIMLTHHQPT